MKTITFPKLIYWLATICFILSLSLLIYVVFGVVLSYLEEVFTFNSGLLERNEYHGKDYMHLRIPIIKFGISYPAKSFEVIFMIAFFGFYALYFFLMKRFFGIFSSEESFSAKHLKTADWFLKINFVPIIFWLAISLYYVIIKRQTQFFDEDFFVLLIHLFVIILIYLYRDMMKKGALLKEENDLTI